MDCRGPPLVDIAFLVWRCRKSSQMKGASEFAFACSVGVEFRKSCFKSFGGNRICFGVESLFFSRNKQYVDASVDFRSSRSGFVVFFAIVRFSRGLQMITRTWPNYSSFVPIFRPCRQIATGAKFYMFFAKSTTPARAPKHLES